MTKFISDTVSFLFFFSAFLKELCSSYMWWFPLWNLMLFQNILESAVFIIWSELFSTVCFPVSSLIYFAFSCPVLISSQGKEWYQTSAFSGQAERQFESGSRLCLWVGILGLRGVVGGHVRTSSEGPTCTLVAEFKGNLCFFLQANGILSLKQAFCKQSFAFFPKLVHSATKLKMERLLFVCTSLSFSFLL